MSDGHLREKLLRLLDGEGAHLTFEEAVADFPLELANAEPPNVPYTPWQLVEHIRFCQWDILDYLRNPNYREARWPDEYWPPRDRRVDEAGWQATLAAYRADLAAVKALVADPATDLLAVLSGPGVSVLQQVLLTADHTAYHVGELAILRQVMAAWPANR